MNRICHWLADRLPLRMILCDGQPYLMRFYICGKAPLHYWPEGVKPRLGWLPFAVYLHGFLRPDQDRDLHNHPWHKAVSLILSGGYDEERRAGDGYVTRRVRPGMLNFIRRNDFHRVSTLHADIVWTLFIHGTKAGTWGFQPRNTNNYIPWRQYVRERSQA